MEKNNLQRISCCLGKYCCFLAEHAFLGFLILILISLIFSGFLFYKYSFLTSKVEPEITGVEALFKEELYQKIILEWQDREERFNGANTKEYLDSFR